MASGIANFSQELAAAAEQVGTSVVTVRARSGVPSSGIHWRKGMVVTVHHAIRNEENIMILTHGKKRLAAKLAGRDAGTDLAVLKLEDDTGMATPSFGDAAQVKLANLVLALGRTRSGDLVASAGIVGGLSGEWRTWRGGRIDQSIRLDLELYPGFSGGPLLNADGKVLGVNTNALSRGRAVSIPVSTVNRTVDELLEKGHIARPYLGVAMQPVGIPESLRSKFKTASASGLMVLHVESGSPADKAGIVMGDVIVELAGAPAQDLEQIHDVLLARKVKDSVEASILRGGAAQGLSITLGERPVR